MKLDDRSCSLSWQPTYAHKETFGLINSTYCSQIFTLITVTATVTERSLTATDLLVFLNCSLCLSIIKYTAHNAERALCAEN